MKSDEVHRPPHARPPPAAADPGIRAKEDEARSVLSDAEFERAQIRETVAGERQGVRLLLTSMLVLVAGGLVVAIVFVDWRLAVIAAALIVVLSWSYVIPAIWTRVDDARSRALDEAIHENGERQRR